MHFLKSTYHHDLYRCITPHSAIDDYSLNLTMKPYFDEQKSLSIVVVCDSLIQYL